MARILSNGWVLGAAAVSGLGAAAILALAGPLDPPAGSVASTYKTLSEVEPRIAINATNTPGDASSVYRIAQPGSYYLTANLTGVTGKHGIEIAVSGVTIDLNGFDVVGVTGSLDGIATVASSLRNITIRNGSVRNWGDDGIDLFSGTTKVARVEGVHSTGNVAYGIRLGDAGLASDCHASYNGESGISGALTVIGCVARNNTQYGISIVNGGTIANSSALTNTNYGIYAANGCTITNCTARGNGDGMIAFGESLIQGCTAVANTGDGINGQQGTTILDCVSSENGADGIIVLNMSLVRGNTCTQ
ncbi:MAG: right-handed parallel beta-helix repeat-containing protein, partial [Phycisphaerae bacterium]|nr:right-handed parallel beta-helix repeat-containing protein [Phycisphaerae bacterium]